MDVTLWNTRFFVIFVLHNHFKYLLYSSFLFCHSLSTYYKWRLCLVFPKLSRFQFPFLIHFKEKKALNLPVVKGQGLFSYGKFLVRIFFNSLLMNGFCVWTLWPKSVVGISKLFCILAKSKQRKWFQRIWYPWISFNSPLVV